MTGLDRRRLLTLLAVGGLAACARTAAPRVPLIAASPLPTPDPSPSSTPSAAPRTVPAPSPPAPSPTASAAPSPAPAEPSPTEAPSPAPAPSPTTTVEPTPQPEPSADPSPSDEPTAAAPGVLVPVLTRGQLGLPAPTGAGRAHAPRGLVVHHTANPTAPASTGPDRFRSLTEGHQARGWIDAAYHYGLSVDGTVHQLRDPGVAGDTATSYDTTGWLLVVCDGNFEADTAPAAMVESLVLVLAALAAEHGIAVGPDTLVGHRDLAATLCPGVDLQTRLPTIRGRVVDLLGTGSPPRLAA